MASPQNSINKVYLPAGLTRLQNRFTQNQKDDRETVYYNNMQNENNNMFKSPKDTVKNNPGSFLLYLPWWVYVVLGSFIFVAISVSFGFSVLKNIGTRRKMMLLDQTKQDIKYTILTEKCQNGLFSYKGRCIKCPNNLVNSKQGCVMYNPELGNLKQTLEQPKAHYRYNPYEQRDLSHYEDSTNHQGFFRAVRGAGSGIADGISRVGRGTRRAGRRLWGGAKRLTRSVLF